MQSEPGSRRGTHGREPMAVNISAVGTASILTYPLEGSGAISTTSQQSSPGPRPDLWEGHTVTGREVVNM